MEQIKKFADVSKQVKLSRSSIYRLVKSGEFPQIIKLSARSSGFLASEIDAWLQEKISDRDRLAANDNKWGE